MWSLSSHSRIFTHIETSLLPVKGCKFWPMLGSWSWPLSSEGSLMCHTYLVISEDPWHSHLLSSVWHLLQDITFLFMAKFKSNRYWIYVSVLKKSLSICHMAEGQQRKRGKEGKPRGAIKLMDLRRKRENDGLTGREYNDLYNILFKENEIFRGCFLSTIISISCPPPTCDENL